MGSNLHSRLAELLKSDGRFIDEECELIRSAVVDHAWRTDRGLVALLLSDDADFAVPQTDKAATCEFLGGQA